MCLGSKFKRARRAVELTLHRTNETEVFCADRTICSSLYLPSGYFAACLDFILQNKADIEPNASSHCT